MSRPRTPAKFPRMKWRGAKRRFRRGGVILGREIRVRLAPDECVVAIRDGQWQCFRTDPAHTATERHQTFPARLNAFFSAPYRYSYGEPDLTGMFATVAHEIAKQDPWARRTNRPHPDDTGSPTE